MTCTSRFRPAISDRRDDTYAPTKFLDGKPVVCGEMQTAAAASNT